MHPFYAERKHKIIIDWTSFMVDKHTDTDLLRDTLKGNGFTLQRVGPAVQLFRDGVRISARLRTREEDHGDYIDDLLTLAGFRMR